MAKKKKQVKSDALVRAEGSAPLYVHLRDELLARIQSGEWTRNTRIPSEGELEERFGVSRITVRRAIMELAREGWLETVQGSGTFVRSPGSDRRAAKSGIVATRHIGVALYGVSLTEITREAAPFNHAILRGIQSVARDFAWRVAIVARAQNSTLVDNLLNGLLDGVILVSPRVAMADEIAQVDFQGVPSVRIHRISEETDVSYIEYDYYAAARLATEHLLTQGYREIAFLCSSVGIQANDLATAGYEEAMKDAGVSVRKAFCLPRCPQPSDPLAYVVNLEPRPQAVIIFESEIAQKSLSRLRELGVRVPDEMALLCLLDENHVLPGVTAVIQQPEELGRLASRALHDLMRRRPSQIQKVLKPRLVVGQTTPQLLTAPD